MNEQMNDFQLKQQFKNLKSLVFLLHGSTTASTTGTPECAMNSKTWTASENELSTHTS